MIGRPTRRAVSRWRGGWVYNLLKGSPPMNKLRLSRISLLVVFALAGIAQTAKRPLNHRDYDPWRAISGQALSHDGKFLAYSLFPEEGDGEVVVRDLASGKELRESAGSLPPAPDTQN